MAELLGRAGLCPVCNPCGASYAHRGVHTRPPATSEGSSSPLVHPIALLVHRRSGRSYQPLPAPPGSDRSPCRCVHVLRLPQRRQCASARASWVTVFTSGLYACLRSLRSLRHVRTERLNTLFKGDSWARLGFRRLVRVSSCRGGRSLQAPRSLTAALAFLQDQAIQLSADAIGIRRRGLWGHARGSDRRGWCSGSI